MADQSLEMLRSCLAQTLSPDTAQRKGAEAYLASLAAQPTYVLQLLRVLENGGEKPEVRLAAALLFKNFVKHNWDPEKEGCVRQSEKDVVKQHLVELMCRMPEALQKQLIEALSTIGEYDFPRQWDALLPQLVHKLQTEADWQVRIGVLMTANTIFKRFRNVFKSDSLFEELKHCLDVFQVRLSLSPSSLTAIGASLIVLSVPCWYRSHCCNCTSRRALPCARQG
jgi:exportin-2 (importin alpha re-exporter)